MTPDELLSALLMIGLTDQRKEEASSTWRAWGGPWRIGIVAPAVYYYCNGQVDHGKKFSVYTAGMEIHSRISTDDPQEVWDLVTECANG